MVLNSKSPINRTQLKRSEMIIKILNYMNFFEKSYSAFMPNPKFVLKYVTCAKNKESFTRAIGIQALSHVCLFSFL